MKYLSLILLLCLIPDAMAQECKLIIGTYTETGEDEGIHVYNFDSKTGECIHISSVSGEQNPSFLAISKDGDYIYAVNEVNDGAISSFHFNKKTGDLDFLNRVSSMGSDPCYISVDKRNSFVFASNYGSGNLIAIPLNNNGSLGKATQVITHSGQSIDVRRQTSSHIHCAVLDPDNKYLLAADLGTDRVSIYKFNPQASQPLSPAEIPFLSVKPGSGPRHLAFHPGLNYVYMVQELTAEISVFEFNNGIMTNKQLVSMIPDEYSGTNGAADIHVSDDGRFLYATNRGTSNTILSYRISKTGDLTQIDSQPVLGDHPRNFAIDPSGNFLLVANQNTNNVIIFARDKLTGKIKPSGKIIEVKKPVCLVFAR